MSHSSSVVSDVINQTFDPGFSCNSDRSLVNREFRYRLYVERQGVDAIEAPNIDTGATMWQLDLEFIRGLERQPARSSRAPFYN
jgi:hypothetical protein